MPPFSPLLGAGTAPLDSSHRPTQDSNRLSVARETESLVDAVMQDAIQHGSVPSPDALLRTSRGSCGERAHLERLCEITAELREKHALSFGELYKELDNTTDYAKFVSILMSRLFKDSVTWGRIVTVLAFVSYSARLRHGEGRQQSAASLTTFVKKFFSDNLVVWIERQGGWMNFYKCFPPQPSSSSRTHPETPMWLIKLGALAAVVGVTSVFFLQTNH